MVNMFSSVYLSLVLMAIMRTGDCEYKIDTSKVEIEGPGLHPNLITMPVRYFDIYAYGKNKTGPKIPKNVFQIQIKGVSESNRECRIWVNELYRIDGSMIVRYKLYETCYNLKISIRHLGENLKGFPIIIKGPIYEEECYCPESDFKKWLADYGCDQFTYKQITYDLKDYQNVDFNKFYNKAARKYTNSPSSSVCSYVIKHNNVHRQCFGKHQDFKIFMDAILLSLARKVQLPDMELLVNLGDWPLATERDNLPIFSWCGSNSTKDIVMPTYEITDSSLQMMGRVTLDMLSVQGNIDTEWDEKEEIAFFQGRDSSKERLKLVEISRKNPSYVNASLTNFFFFKEEEHKYGPKVPHVSFFEFFKYKYLLNMDGTVAAFRFPFLLAGDSVVFKQDSEYYEHFHRDLKPWVHYIPFKRDLSDLVDKIKLAKINDESTKEIADNGKKYARANLHPQPVFCYHAVLFQTWSEILNSEIKIRPGMDLVEQPASKCQCDKLMFKEEL